MNHTNPNYDVVTGGSRVYVSYNTTTSSIATFYLNAFLSESAAVTQTGEVATNCIHVDYDSVNQQVWVCYHNGSAVKYLVWDYNLDATAVIGPHTVETVSGVSHIITYVNAGSANFFYDVSATPTYNTSIRTNTGTNTGTIGTAASLILSLGIASKTFYYNGKVYFLAAFQSPLWCQRGSPKLY